ncbi:MAG: hypothetical protein ACP5KX_07370 [Caldisericia bacterium]
MEIDKIKEFKSKKVRLTLSNNMILEGYIIDIFSNGHIRFSTKEFTIYILSEEIMKLQLM